MLYIYCIGIKFYGFIIWLASFFNPKAKSILSGRKSTLKYISEQKLLFPLSDWIWIHASSLGEFEQGRHLIERLKIEYPEYKIALSFFSPSGYDARKDYEKVDMVFYLPLDTAKNAELLLESLNPQLAIFIKYDFWWNILNQLQIAQVPTVFVSSVIRSNHYFVKYQLGKIRSILKGINHFYVQNEQSKELLKSLSILQVTVAGDSRLDSILAETTPENIVFSELSNWKSDDKCMLYGSVHEADIEVIKSMQSIDARHLIVPHDIHVSNIQVFKNSFPNAGLYSESGFQKQSMIILDQMGILKYIYRFSDVIYIGGGFGKGIHNTLEPLVHLKPLIIGPNYLKFPEAVTLVGEDVIKTISTPKEAKNTALQCLNEDIKVRKAKQKRYIFSNSGATSVILASLRQNNWV